MSVVTAGPPVPAHAVRHLDEVILEVFESMVLSPLTPLPAGSGRSCQAEVTGTVAFNGSWNGFVSIVTSMVAARRITATLLECDESQVEDQLRDAIGEVANMAAGALRTRMAEPGAAWTITIPVVATGKMITIAPPGNVSHVVQSYLMGEEVVDIHLVVTTVGVVPTA